MKTLLILITLILTLFQVGTRSLLADEKQILPSFKGRDLGNRLVEVEKLLAKGPVLITFWATWCAPCLREMEKIEVLYEKYREKGFSVIGINQDVIKSRAELRTFVKTRHISFLIIMDRERKLGNLLHITALPSTFLIGKDRHLYFFRTGYREGDEKILEKKIVEAFSDYSKK
ncbi:MAG: TlpA family protein disulfide reductase [Gemmatimonadetes bacterium]|nr:TlpA family protein disulfide reductase [Gemmatimonadota bacterium]